MPEPSEEPRWADAGSVVEPADGKKDIGWLQGERVPAEWLNWLFYTIWLWIVWFKTDKQSHLNGSLVGSPVVAYDGGSEIVVDGFKVVVNDKIYDCTAGLTLEIPTLTANQWYYLYVQDSGDGSPELDIQATAPDSGRIFRADSEAQRYLCSIRTDGAGAPLAFRYERGRCLYRVSEMGSAALQVLSAQENVTFTNVDLSDLLPPHARLAIVRWDFTRLTANSSWFRLRTDGDSDQGWQTDIADITDSRQTGWLEIETSNLQVIEYRTEADSSDCALSLWVPGYQE